MVMRRLTEKALSHLGSAETLDGIERRVHPGGGNRSHCDEPNDRSAMTSTGRRRHTVAAMPD